MGISWEMSVAKIARKVDPLTNKHWGTHKAWKSSGSTNKQTNKRSFHEPTNVRISPAQI
jgi:hypothetical protein